MFLSTDSGSRMQHYMQAPSIQRGRTAFSLAEPNKTSIQFDYLFPVYSKFIYPGDTLSMSMKFLARLNTQVAVLYDDLYLDAHAWYTPLRQIDDTFNRQQFNEKTTVPAQDNSSLVTPGIDLTLLSTDGFGEKSLYDSFGFPTEADVSASGQHVNNYEPRAYYHVWDQNYRDQNLQDMLLNTVDYITNGGAASDDPTDYVLQKRGKRHDMFTTCLTSAQKGTASQILLSGTADLTITGDGTNQPTFDNGTEQLGLRMQGSQTNPRWTDSASPTVSGNVYWDDPALAGTADLTDIAVITVNDLRRSIAIQQLLEADARGGTRAIEAIKNIWGVTVPDFTLQRPLYCGGCTHNFDANVVPQTSATSGSNFQADLAQFSATMGSLSVNESFQEHGIFFILVSARSNLGYQQGLKRERSYESRYDFFNPFFSNLGEVAVLKKELNMEGDATDDEVLGYQEYGYELRFGMPQVTREFRSSYATSKDSQHMFEDFGGVTPTLNAAFIESNTPIDRNITVDPATADPIELNTFVSGKIARTIPMFSIPGLDRL